MSAKGPLKSWKKEKKRVFPHFNSKGGSRQAGQRSTRPGVGLESRSGEQLSSAVQAVQHACVAFTIGTILDERRLQSLQCTVGIPQSGSFSLIFLLTGFPELSGTEDFCFHGIFMHKHPRTWRSFCHMEVMEKRICYTLHVMEAVRARNMQSAVCSGRHRNLAAVCVLAAELLLHPS